MRAWGRKGTLALLSCAMAAPAATAQHQRHEAPARHEQEREPGPHGGMQHGEMPGLFGPYPMSREASGTSWQPESTPAEGHAFSRGSWMLMVHGFADLVLDHQGGPRGETQVYGPTMAMVMARRPAGRGTFGLRAMVSLDPATVGRRGYPLLLQTGETGDGRTRLIDRQHPHDLFMELAASHSIPLGGEGALFGYLGLPGEPALGPPAFMHRFSGAPLPESPILHHWLDSTHISFGVATAGVSWRGVKLEASRFTGREPDEERWNVDEPTFDSYAGRLSFHPTRDWALQLSAGHLNSPEQLEPGVDVDRFTGSVSYNRPAGAGNWQATAAWGRNRKEGRSQDGVLLESAWWSGARHTVVARAEWVEKDELFESGPQAGTTFEVAKLSAGYIYDFARLGRVALGAGALASVYHLPRALEAAYGERPVSFMLFLRGVVR